MELAEKRSAQPSPELIKLHKEMERLKVELERKRGRGGKRLGTMVSLVVVLFLGREVKILVV